MKRQTISRTVTLAGCQPVVLRMELGEAHRSGVTYPAYYIDDALVSSEDFEIAMRLLPTGQTPR